MNALYIIAALLAIGIPAFIILGSRGRTVDERRRMKAQPGGRRAEDKAAA